MRSVPWGVWVLALLIAAVTSLPYLAGWLAAPDGWVYSGAPVLPAGAQLDYYSHLAKMWQGSRGQWAYELLFTHEPHPGVPLLQGFYVALGAVAAVTPFSLPVVYHIARFLLTAGMVIALWAYVSHYFVQPRDRWLALLLATAAGGMSWLLLMIDPAQTREISPIEFWLLDAFNLLGALSMPHFTAAIILQAAAVLAFERWVQAEGAKLKWVGGLAVALVAAGLVQPYSIVLFAPLFGLAAGYHIFIARRVLLGRGLWLLLPFALHTGLTVYHLWAVRSDPVWSDFAAQNLTLSPPPVYYVLGYLPFWLPTILAGRRLLQERWLLPLLWVMIVAVLVYAPLPTQRRYLLGVQTPLSVLAAYGWSSAVLPRLRQGYGRLATAVYLVFASVGVVGMLAANVAGVLQAEGLYYSPDEWAAAGWLREANSDQDAVILTTFDRSGQGSGGRVVAATGQRVYAGHWIETAFLDEKVNNLHRFFAAETSDDWRQAFLKETGVVYIWYDENTRELGDWNPDTVDYLEAVFESDTVTIYRAM